MNISNIYTIVISLLLGCDVQTTQAIQTQKNVDAATAIPVIIKDSQAKVEILSSNSLKLHNVDANSSDLARSINIRLAAKKLNGIIIEPNAEFSFNEVVGPRTAKAGFVDAPILFMGVIKPGMGGGICKVSSALYEAAMFGGMKVTRRRPHSRPLPYYKLGRDAAVNYPDIDLRFKNLYEDPITINTYIKNNSVVISLIGTKNSYSSVTYKYHPYPTVSFERRNIHSKWVNKPKRYQQGKVGTPGYAIWKYRRFDKDFIVRVESNYKPLEEIWIIND